MYALLCIGFFFFLSLSPLWKEKPIKGKGAILFLDRGEVNAVEMLPIRYYGSFLIISNSC